MPKKKNAFWFRFIGTKRPDIARGLGQHLVDTHILPRLDDYMGGVFEEMAREHARILAAGETLKATRVEPWWSADGAHEIDMVGLANRSSVNFVGSVKWSAKIRVRPPMLSRPWRCCFIIMG